MLDIQLKFFTQFGVLVPIFKLNEFTLDSYSLLQ